jgi:hypothetical protein
MKSPRRWMNGVEAELQGGKKYEQDSECNIQNYCTLNAVGTNSECAVPISILLTHFDAMRNWVFTLTRRLNTSAMFSLLHIFNEFKNSTSSLII